MIGNLTQAGKQKPEVINLMSKEMVKIIDLVNEIIVDESVLFENACKIIDFRKNNTMSYANQEITLMYWEIGKFISDHILNRERASYGKKVLPTLSAKLQEIYGRNFSERNLNRMVRFFENFDFEILPTVSAKLSWSHIVELLTLKSQKARLYYINEVVERGFGVRELRNQISRKSFERREIANAEISDESPVPFNVFKDPYLLDMLGLKDNHLEADLEEAILRDLEAFLLEFGNGFTFVERQKRMIVGGEDIKLDLLLYNRKVKRLVAVELKIGAFKASYKSQMELYLEWLDRYERQEGEESPIGIILCATANREKIEMLKMDKAGIAVAEYWATLPPKQEFEKKIREIMFEVGERLERRKDFNANEPTKKIDYFYQIEDEESE